MDAPANPRPERRIQEAPIAPRRAPPAQYREAASQPGPVARAARPRDKPRASKIAISAILVFALLGTVFAVTTVLTWGSYNGNATYSYSPGSPSGQSSWSFAASTANLNIQYTSNPSAPEVQVDVHYSFAGAFMNGKTATDLYTATFDNSSAPKLFSFVRKDWWNFAMFDNTSVVITLKTSVKFNISASVGSGNVGLEIPDDIQLSDVTLHSSSGNVLAEIADNVTIDGDLEMTSSSGNVVLISGNSTFMGTLDLRTLSGNVISTMSRGMLGDNLVANSSSGNIFVTLVNATLSSNIRLDIGVSSGNIWLTVQQLVNPVKNVSSYVSSSSGNVNVNYKAGTTLANAYFTCMTGSGIRSCTDNGGFQASALNTIFQSTNPATPCRFNANLHASSGNIHVIGQIA